MRIVIIKKTEEGLYQLLFPRDTGNPPEDVGHWAPEFSDESFPNFYSRLFEDYFPDIDKDDRILYDTSITQRERDHIDQAFNLCKARNIGCSILNTALEKSESVRGKAPAPIEGLQQRVLSALEEIFG